MKCFRFIAAERASSDLAPLPRPRLSRSGFHAWPRSARDLADAWLAEQVRAIHAESRFTYGTRRVRAALSHRGIAVSRKRVARLMRMLGLSGLLPKRFKRTTISRRSCVARTPSAFVEEVRGDDPEVATKLRIAGRELRVGGAN